MRKGFLEAIATIVGTIVGAGIFAIPEAAVRAGFAVTTWWLFFLAAVVALLHTMYGEVVLATRERHRLVGYARLYLGKHAAQLAFVSTVVGMVGSLLAYIILAGDFLFAFFREALPSPLLTTIVWAVLTAAVAMGIRTVARMELLMTGGLVAILFVLLASLATEITPEHFVTVHSWDTAFLPYGVFLFALWGAAAIPEIRDVVEGDDRSFRRAIIIGTIIPAILYLVFMTVTVGAFGEDAAGNIVEVLSQKPLMRLSVAAFGFFAVATSFLVLGDYLVKTFEYDLRVRRPLALAILASPLLLFFLGARDFLIVVSVIGTILGAIDGTIITLSWHRVRSQNVSESPRAVRVPLTLAYLLVVLFLLGATIEIAQLVR